MKKIFSLFKKTLLFTIIVFHSCSEDFIPNDMESKKKSKNEKSLIVQKIKELGYKVENIIELEDYYVVEGDLRFSKNIKDYENESQIFSRQYHSTSLVADEIIGGCNVNPNTAIQVFCELCQDSTVQNIPTWVNAVDAAIADWNNFSGGSRNLFFLTTNANNADIIIRQFPASSNNNGSFAGMSGFPSCGRPYFEVLIETSFQYPSNDNITDEVHRRNLIGHELGHAIGFKHSDETNGILIPGTEFLLGTNSIMKSTIISRAITGLTNEDQLAAQYLYGCNSNVNPESIYPPNFSNIITSPTKFQCDKFNIKGNYEICETANNTITWANNSSAAITLNIYANPSGLDAPIQTVGPITFTGSNFNFPAVDLSQIPNFTSGNSYYASVSFGGLIPISSPRTLINYVSCTPILEECINPCDFSFPNPIEYQHNGSNSYTFTISQSLLNHPCFESYGYQWYFNNQLYSYNESFTTTISPLVLNKICLLVYFDNPNGADCKKDFCTFIQ